MTRLTAETVFVRGLRLDAEIGVHAHEHGRTQMLTVDIEAEVPGAGEARRLGDTLDYNRLVEAARTLAEGGHVLLVEEFAARLLDACLALPDVRRVKVRVEKPGALAQASAAGVELEGRST